MGTIDWVWAHPPPPFARVFCMAEELPASKYLRPTDISHCTYGNVQSCHVHVMYMYCTCSEGRDGYFAHGVPVPLD